MVATSGPPFAAGVQREVIDVLLQHGARMDLRGSVGHDALLLGVIERFGERDQREERKDGEPQLRVVRPEPEAADQDSGEQKDVDDRGNDYETDDAFAQDDGGRSKTDEQDPERIEKTDGEAAIQPAPKPRGSESDNQGYQEKLGQATSADTS